MDPRLGTVLDGKFEIKRVLGRGGMGVVYLARQISMDRDVAIKVLHPHAVGDGDAVKRFLHEAKVASKLRHPNIITVFDFGQAPDGTLFLVMELLSGSELARVVEENGALPPARVVHIMAQVCDAVHQAHVAGLVHRDLKPENVYLTDGSSLRGDFVKVLDFGIARNQAVEGAERLTRTGVMCGTPAYMSPEQILGEEVDARSDIYSLGVMLYELITGRLPFIAESSMRLLMMHLESAVPSLEASGAAVPQQLFDVVKKALSKKREDRFGTALELANALVNGLESARREDQFDVDAVVVGASRRREGVAPTSQAQAVAPPSSIQGGRRARDTIEPLAAPQATRAGAGARKPGRRWLVAAVAAIAVAGGALALLPTGSDAETSVAVETPREQREPERKPGKAPVPIESAASEAPSTARASEPRTAGNPAAATPARAEPPSNPVPAVASATPTPPTAPSKITIATSPAGAIITLDGAKLGVSPLDVPLPIGEATAELALRLAGYEVHTQVITSKSGNISVALERKKRGAPPPNNEAGTTAPKPPDKGNGRDGAGIIE